MSVFWLLRNSWNSSDIELPTLIWPPFPFPAHRRRSVWWTSRPGSTVSSAASRSVWPSGWSPAGSWPRMIRERSERRPSYEEWPWRPSGPPSPTRSPGLPPRPPGCPRSTSARPSTTSAPGRRFPFRPRRPTGPRRKSSRRRNASPRPPTTSSRRSRCHRAGCRSTACPFPSSTRWRNA